MYFAQVEHTARPSWGATKKNTISTAIDPQWHLILLC
jgi:hypothetical protein